MTSTTIIEWLKTATKQLSEAGVQSARLDALILLEDALGMDRALILAHDEQEIPGAKIEELKKLLIRRVGHEPLAYIRGHSEFYGRKFVIKPGVLTPRPESEAMIDELKQLHADGKIPVQGKSKVFIADVGTGSGALGITASKELSGAQIELLDIDDEALEIAQINVDLITSGLSVKKSDLLASSAQDNDILLCNLPYVPDEYQINRAAGFEPSIALFGGEDGLDLYHKLFEQVTALPYRPLYILTEALPQQHNALKEIAEQSGYKLLKINGYIQVFAQN